MSHVIPAADAEIAPVNAVVNFAPRRIDST